MFSSHIFRDMISHHAGPSGWEDLEISECSGNQTHSCGQSIQRTQRKQHFLKETEHYNIQIYR